MVRCRLLGGIVVEAADGSGVTGRAAQRKRLGVLALLAASPAQALSRDKIAGYLWPDSDSEKARRQIAAALYDLRKALGDAAILARGDDLLLDSDVVATDVRGFEEALAAGRMEQAVQLYRGPFLDGFFVSDAPEFEHWVDSQRDRLAAAYGNALEALAEQRRAAGDLVGAAEAWRRLAAHDPYNSRVTLALMRALDAAGDRAGALRQARVHELMLREQLGLEPDAAIAELTERLQSAPEPQREPAADPVAASVSQPPTVPASATPPLQALPPRRAARVVVRRRAVAAAAGVLILAMAAFGYVGTRSGDDGVATDGGRVAGEAVRTGPPRILVLPFDDQSGDPDLGRFGEIIADWISRGLLETGLVHVVDELDADRGPRSTTRDIADLLIRGQYDLRGDSVYVRAELRSVSTGGVDRLIDVAAVPRSAPLSALDELRSKSQGAVASALDLRLASTTGPWSAPPTFEAYQEYVAGLEHFRRQQYPEAAVRFTRSATLDPEFHLALLWSAFAYRYVAPRAHLDSVVAVLAQRRDALPPLERHGADFFIAGQSGDLHGALAALRRASEMVPGSHWGYLRAWQAARLNFPREALAALEPLQPGAGWLEGWEEYWLLATGIHHRLGNFGTELELARRAVARHPRLLEYELTALAALGRSRELRARAMAAPVSDHAALLHAAAVELHAHDHREAAAQVWREALARSEPGTALRAEVLYRLELWAEARSAFLTLHEEDPRNLEHLGRLGGVAVHMEAWDEADRIERKLREAAERDPRWLGVSRYMQARIASLRGDSDGAVRLLLSATRSQPPGPHTEPDFYPILEHPALRRLREPAG